MNKIQEAQRILGEVRKEANGCIVMCSFGKDSVVALDLVYPLFDRVVCVFMYFVKNLRHIEGWIKWAKARYPRMEFLEIPHWNLSYILRGGLYSVEQPKIKLLSLSDVVEAVRVKVGLYYVVLGMKKADGLNRNLMLKTYEQNDYINKGMVYPLASWTQKDVLAYMKQHRMPEPVRYSLKASNGIGFNKDCLLWLRERFPDDLQRIFDVFPMSERELFEYDYHKDKEIRTNYGESEEN